MLYENLIKNLGFTPKENTSDIFEKKYFDCKDYCIEIDFKTEKINYGKLITAESKTTQNFSQEENWVVLECVNRLLEKGYQPENITLEKTYPSGHGTSGRLDILVARDNSTAYLMIECKTWGTEFDKELKKIKRNGGQLFTYFQQDKNTEVLMLYTSALDGKELKYRNEIIKIEEDYRQTGNVKDFYERWNKLPKSNGIFDTWVKPYEYQSKALTKKDLKVLKQEDSSFIFNRFLEILRHNVVSDKPNAFNKIFTLFLCKIVDENIKDGEQLDFQWLEGEDDHISFQKRLTDLYNRGMLELLEKKVTDVSDSEFDKRFQQVDERYREEFKEILTEIRLKKNNEFAIKEVYDDASFEENAKVVKEVVELLQVYQIRYNYRQQFLSDFFELLLTTGLKQESGQFFTPVPIARFIIKSIPLREITEKKIEHGNKNDLLPLIIDYAAGSGHFITETMEEIQKYIDTIDEKKYNPSTKKALKKWKDDQFDWAEDYVYAIEKDYRLVKTAKVSCYLHGDGLAKIIHGDGLGDFLTSTEFKDLLKETDKIYPQDNKQFDIIISNPPYSVSAFKGTMMNEEKAKKAFELYSRLTDQSGEIECLFVERTKQLLKDGGIAGIILPSSILSNTGIYTQTREIILKYFKIVAIAELGSATFMATGTNTVTLFLRRRNNADAINIKANVNKIFINHKDVTVNGIEKPVKKYLIKVWEGITFDDYVSLLKKQPTEKLKKHEIYEEYKKKIKAENEIEKLDAILEIEKEKLLYFILAYPQKIALIKTGEKKEEKRFLGYEFSNRRGSEGIHSIKRSETIDDCTQLYDANSFDNSEKASTYIYKAFNGKFDLDIPDNLKKNISYMNLVDMFTFDRVNFEKTISLTSKKKVVIKSKWELKKIADIVEVELGKRIVKQKKQGEIYPVYGGGGETFKANDFNRENRYIISRFGMSPRCMRFIKGKFFLNDSGFTVKPKLSILNNNYLQYYLFQKQEMIYYCGRGVAQKNIDLEQFNELKIPLPTKDIQKKIVSKFEIVEKQKQKAVEDIEKYREKIRIFFLDKSGEKNRFNEICGLKAGKFVKANDINKNHNVNLFPCYGGNGLRGYTETFTNQGQFSLVGRQGALCGNVHLVSGKFHATEHALVVYPKKGVNNIWLHYQLVSMELNQYATGTAQPGLSVMNLNPIEIRLPSIARQTIIVSKIEEIEKQIIKLEKDIETIPRQKEAILKKYL